MARVTTGKPYHHGELREALIVAGRALMEERGLRGFTLRECARRASVSHAAPAHHFASMDALLAEIAARGYLELAAAMTSEVRRSSGTPAARLVGQGVGYMAFAAANPAMFRLMFSLEADQLESPALTAAVKAANQLHREAIEAVIPDAPADVKERMADFAWASVHGFITLVLERQIGEKDSPRALKARGLAVLSVVVETVVRTGSR